MLNHIRFNISNFGFLKKEIVNFSGKEDLVRYNMKLWEYSCLTSFVQKSRISGTENFIEKRSFYDTDTILHRLTQDLEREMNRTDFVKYYSETWKHRISNVFRKIPRTS